MVKQGKERHLAAEISETISKKIYYNELTQNYIFIHTRLKNNWTNHTVSIRDTLYCTG